MQAYGVLNPDLIKTILSVNIPQGQIVQGILIGYFLDKPWSKGF